MLAIINDILDFSKIEAGKLNLEKVLVDPAEVADDVMSLFAERARSKGLDLAAYISPAVSPIATDPVRLNQVLGNLINNALKFTEKGHVLLSIEPDGSSSVRFAVRDTGIGIPEDKLDQIFAAFSQADQSTTRRFGGTGLGLAICRRIIACMGGGIRVSSQPGEGSMFCFSLPATVDSSCQRPVASRQALLRVGGQATTGVLQRYLGDLGFDVLEPGTVPQGKALILCDCESLDDVQTQLGDEAISRLLLISEIGNPRAEKLARQLEAGGVLYKPILRRDLFAVVGDQEDRRLIAHSAGTERSVPFPRFEGVRALVADDSAVNREVVIEALSRLSVEAEVVETGVQAVAAVERAEFDIVLMDGSMPEMDGFEAARRIREMEATVGRRRVPIIALTAHVVGTAAYEWRRAGMDDVVFKPSPFERLPIAWLVLLPAAHRVALSADAVAEKTYEPSRSGEASSDDVTEPLLDEATTAQLQSMAGQGRSDFVQRVFKLYAEHAPSTRDQLSQAMRESSVDDAAKAAHALKSMSFNIGAVAVANLASDIERNARNARRLCSQDEVG